MWRRYLKQWLIIQPSQNSFIRGTKDWSHAFRFVHYRKNIKESIPIDVSPFLILCPAKQKRTLTKLQWLFTFLILPRTWVVPCFSHALFGLEYLSWWEYLRRTEGTHILFWKMWFDIIDQEVELYCFFASYFPPKRRCERLVPTFGRLPQGWWEYPGECFWY